jgi:hypothetical protein
MAAPNPDICYVMADIRAFNSSSSRFGAPVVRIYNQERASWSWILPIF